MDDILFIVVGGIILTKIFRVVIYDLIYRK